MTPGSEIDRFAATSAAGRLSKLLLFLGPTGIFFLPVSAIGSFRAFYLVCAIFLLDRIRRMHRTDLGPLGILTLINALFLASAAYARIVLLPSDISLTYDPLARWLILFVLSYSFYFLSNDLIRGGSLSSFFATLDFSFYGFLALTALGLWLYLAVVAGALPASIWETFVTLEQNSLGYLRFSPGTYPNEYGTLASFYAIYALLRMICRQGSNVVNVCSAVLFVACMALASTRSAYVTFVIGLLITVVGMPGARGKVKFIAAIVFGIPALAVVFSLINFDAVGVILGGYHAALNPSQGSLGERFTGWVEATTDFVTSPLLGAGFESPNIVFLHNLFLQELYGLGLVGASGAAVLVIVFWCAAKQAKHPLRRLSLHAGDFRRFHILRLIAIEHVFLFGLNNHNQAHFLTWLAFSLFLITPVVKSGNNV